MSVRPVKSVRPTKATLEGAGVRLQRAFGFGDTTEFDPFLLFDDFRNDNPDDFLAGFPWHPHRGIETITYVLAGTVEHKDSLGNAGTLGAGDVQWMTAGRGILHQEMPQGDARGRMHGFQLWANLPSAHKMTAPRYQDIGAAGIPVEIGSDGPALLWDKFMGLVANSSLCALTRSPMGVVQKDEECWALYTAVFNEVVAVGRASGISIPPDKAEARLARARTSPPMVIPSMAVDLMAGNRLEYPWLGGRVRALGREHGVPTPANDFIGTALKPFLSGKAGA